MAFLDYKCDGSETLKSLSDYYNVSIQQIALVNNIREPWDENTPMISGQNLVIPELYNGNSTFENDTNTMSDTFNMYDFNTKTQEQIRSAFRNAVGFASQGKCFLFSNAGSCVFPCYPESYSDSHQASMASQTPLGRSEPFLIYQNSGPRTVNVSFRMDREMTHITDIGSVVGTVQSMCYPASGSGTIIPRVTLVIGSNCSITGVIQNVNTNWSDTIIANQYMVVTLDFSVTECTGYPKTSGVVAGLRGV